MHIDLLTNRLFRLGEFRANTFKGGYKFDSGEVLVWVDRLTTFGLDVFWFGLSEARMLLLNLGQLQHSYQF